MLEWIESYFDCKDHFMNTVYSVSASLASCCHSMFCVYDEWLVDFRTLKKESHHLEIIHTNASVHAVFSQSSPLDLKTTSISFHWLLRTEEPVLIQGRGGGVLQQVKAFLSCALFMKVLTLLHWTHIHMFLEHGIVILNKRINMWLKSRLSAFI